MKIKALKKAYYNDIIIKLGSIIDFKGNKVPSWASLAEQAGAESEIQNDTLSCMVLESGTPVSVDVISGVDSSSNCLSDFREVSETKRASLILKSELRSARDGEALAAKTRFDIAKELELQNELDVLITEATEIGVWVTGTGKSTQEQICEYKIAIAQAKPKPSTMDNNENGSSAKAGKVSEEELDELINEATQLNIVLEQNELNLSLAEKIEVLKEKIEQAS